MLWLILIFIIVPAIEIGIFLWTSAEVGVLPVLFMIVFTGVAGVALVRKEGKETWQKAQLAIYNNERPGEEILDGIRSEEHTSELQSRFDLVCRRLLEKKKIKEPLQI